MFFGLLFVICISFVVMLGNYFQLVAVLVLISHGNHFSAMGIASLDLTAGSARILFT
jgi:hypothetical protein